MKTNKVSTSVCASTQSRSKHVICAAIVYLILSLVALFFASRAYSENLPISAATSESHFYLLESTAVVVALDSIPIDSDVEYGGSIVTCDKRQGYTYTKAVTQDQTLAVSFETSVPKSWGACKIVGRYHSHPASAPYGEYFSPGDIQTAVLENLPIYLLVCRTGSKKVYRPGAKTTVLNVSGHLVRVSSGDWLQ